MTFSNSRRSSNETHGGRRNPRTERPVRQRDVKTYFPDGSILVVESWNDILVLVKPISLGRLKNGTRPETGP